MKSFRQPHFLGIGIPLHKCCEYLGAMSASYYAYLRYQFPRSKEQGMNFQGLTGLNMLYEIARRHILSLQCQISRSSKATLSGDAKTQGSLSLFLHSIFSPYSLRDQGMTGKSFTAIVPSLPQQSGGWPLIPLIYFLFYFIYFIIHRCILILTVINRRLFLNNQSSFDLYNSP